MKIGIVNAGNIGGTLAKAWAKAGHEIMVSKHGSQTKLQPLLKQLGPRAYAGSLAEAARFGEVTLFSVYWPHFQTALIVSFGTSCRFALRSRRFFRGWGNVFPDPSW